MTDIFVVFAILRTRLPGQHFNICNDLLLTEPLVLTSNDILFI
jgi:hypothetical protein